MLSTGCSCGLIVCDRRMVRFVSIIDDLDLFSKRFPTNFKILMFILPDFSIDNEFQKSPFIVFIINCFSLLQISFGI